MTDRSEHDGPGSMATAPSPLWLTLDAGPSRVTYAKRFRMELDLARLPEPNFPPGYTLLPWNPTLLQAHADTLFTSFIGEIDSGVFPSLSSASGCYCLMTEISSKSGFQPHATWLLAHGPDACGSVQGLRERQGIGAIQNLGIKPAYRGRGLGEALLLQSLRGFQQAGLGRAILEVTASNDAAIRLYRRVGFRRRRVVYKAVLAKALV